LGYIAQFEYLFPLVNGYSSAGFTLNSRQKRWLGEYQELDYIAGQTASVKVQLDEQHFTSLHYKPSTNSSYLRPSAHEV